MGTPKPLLPYGTQTLLERLSQTLILAGIPQVGVVVNPHARAVVQEAERLSLRTLFNERPELGMSHSAAIALENCHADWVAILPCDMPFLTPHVVAKCLDALSEHSAIVQPFANGRNRHPVFISQTVFAPAVLALRGGAPLREFLKTASIRQVAFESSQPFEDIDTFEDYKNSLRVLNLADG